MTVARGLILNQKNNESFVREMAYKDSNGVAIPITGFTIKMDVRTTTGTLIYAFSVGTGITITSGAGGLFTVQLNDISAWTVGTNVADVVINDGTLDVATETFYIKVIDGITE